MQLKTLILTLFLAAALPLLAYEAPITEPGATGVTPMYTTAGGGPHRAAMEEGDDTPYNPSDWTGGSGSEPGFGDNGSPVGAPWILLGFAAAYGAFRLKKGE